MLAALSLSVAPAEPALSEPELRACLGTTRVGPPGQFAAMRAGLSAPAWRDACRQVREANARRLSLTRSLLASGRSPVGGYASALRELKRAEAAADPLLKELFRRTAKDQALRSSLSFIDGKKTYAAGLSPEVLELLDRLVAFDVVEVDEENREWLKGVIARRGWFVISRDGAEADLAAWLIVQHADNDREFQRSMVAMLEPLAAKGETSWNRLAYLHDRWAAGADQPQTYGIQGRCLGPGRWEPREVAAPEGLEARRKNAGLPPMAEHASAQARRCR